ncbi:hypothetical protein [Streptomyces zagrosensis]|uniref:Uncharacterized protein n=1 Tax=Streptomyces zagrosensis TaxID=1042984 RepID=A0A7W9Q5C7_9ACTN|nr:hypothetical protein [Streptomyces zagrosensis]MBB5933923.1 hypothetical protein [Streptomyces zagrosensis]
MARDYDSQLLESVAVRRRRLRDASLFGAQRSRRTLDENVGKLFGGIALAAVVCAGCVGWSFISEKFADKEKQDQRDAYRSAVVVRDGEPRGVELWTPVGRVGASW